MIFDERKLALELNKIFGTSSRLFRQKNDVRECYEQIPVNPVQKLKMVRSTWCFKFQELIKREIV